MIYTIGAQRRPDRVRMQNVFADLLILLSAALLLVLIGGDIRPLLIIAQYKFAYGVGGGERGALERKVFRAQHSPAPHDKQVYGGIYAV